LALAQFCGTALVAQNRAFCEFAAFRLRALGDFLECGRLDAALPPLSVDSRSCLVHRGVKS